MIAVIQRVTRASVDVADERIATIGRGILALVAVEKGDGKPQVERLAERLLGYRVFPDPEGRMNLSLDEIGGELLLVSQFTLAADTAKGRRPSFTPAAEPALGAALFDALLDECRRHLGEGRVACGRFGADMLVSLVNDGPVTFILKAPPDRLPH
ncbi:D-aminoacyl-tRNA deacylase [Methylotetracoccus oryzae]|uniref:D-aminoacyl-tRNA deacylase n=1 Tax=Methylotetracoccus oryzae TaxID=1919059 RepID=UPI001117BCC2|nr:D-aminoacyl-tRNA deacylase [Methylotetracoccus oryzae]